MYKFKISKINNVAEWINSGSEGAGPNVPGSVLKKRVTIDIEGEPLEALIPCDSQGEFTDEDFHSGIYAILKQRPTPHPLEQKEITYQGFVVGEHYKVGDVVVYSDALYQVIQAHTSQSDWTPDVTPALFKSTLPEGEIGEWVQPTGSHDAYNAGDKVTYKDIIWISKIDANTTVPDGDEPYNRYWEPKE